jgi:hypothetical protein
MDHDKVYWRMSGCYQCCQTVFAAEQTVILVREQLVAPYLDATSFPDPHCGSSEPKLTHSGTALSQPHEECRVLALNACSLALT